MHAFSKQMLGKYQTRRLDSYISFFWCVGYTLIGSSEIFDNMQTNPNSALKPTTRYQNHTTYTK